MTTTRALLRAGSALFLLYGMAAEVHAIVGAPLTPVSVAGVARRTTRRTVAVASTSTAAAASASQQQAAAAQQQAAASQQQAAAAQQQAAEAQEQAAAAEADAAQARAEAAAAQQQAAQATQAAKLPPGTVISALPSGCTSINLGGVDYFNCAGTYLRPAMQSNNVVYIVSQP